MPRTTCDCNHALLGEAGLQVPKSQLLVAGIHREQILFPYGKYGATQRDVNWHQGKGESDECASLEGGHE